MKLSIFTTASSPILRGDLWEQSLKCYMDLADEVQIIDGKPTNKTNNGLHIWVDQPKTEVLFYKWPKEFSWEFIGQQFQRGYEACTGDWVLHMDLDFIIHENDFEALRQNLEVYNDEPAISLLKRQFILPDRFNLKSRLVVAVNKGKFGDRIRFDGGGESDLCQPSLDGKLIRPGSVPDVAIPFYNYEKILKSKEQIMDDVGRMARAWQRHFGEYKLGGPDDESAYREWLKMVKGRFQKPQEHMPLESHPRYIQGTIKNLTPEQWGYSGFGMEVNDYATN